LTITYLVSSFSFFQRTVSIFKIGLQS
jgi:hypothetical protein